MFEMDGRNPILAQWDLHFLGVVISNFTLTHPRMRSFLADPDEHFDVIVCEIFLNEAMLGLGYHFNAPIIGYSTFGASKWTNEMVGTPSPLSYVPHAFLSFTDRMSFVQRVANTIMTIHDNIQFLRHLHLQSQLYEQLFDRRADGTPKPSLDELRRNVALVLLNSHFTLGTPRPYVPNMIEIGGVHINRAERRPLPAGELRDFVDGADKRYGVVYFSMGSNLRSADMPKHVQAGILRALGRLRQRVLWKWEDAELPNKPANVLVRSWFPQDDILAHPNVRLFITHGGLLSTTESIYHGVPMVGIPVFGDQSLNMGRAEAGGFGRTVAYKNLSETSLEWAANEVLNNGRYAQQAKLASERYRDQPSSPLETGVFWVEYVARHNGAPHMRCAGLDLHVWEYHNLDVYAVLLAMLIAFLLAVKYVLCLCCCTTNSKKSSAASKKKRN